MNKSFRYRLYPTKDQIVSLESHLRSACELYNCALEERKGAWNRSRKSVTCYDQCKYLKDMRSEGLLHIDNSQCCQNVLHRLDKTFKAFFARIKRGDKPGFPRFKSSRRYNSLTFPVYGNGCKLLDKHVYFQGIGNIKVKLHRPVLGVIKTSSIKREGDKWFVTFSATCNSNPLETSELNIGVDVGLTNFAVLSDGSEIDNPRLYKAGEDKLRAAHRTVDRRQNKKSNRRRKSIKSLSKMYAKIRHRRSDFHHKVSRMLVNKYGTIVVEDLNIKGLSRGILAKSVHDAGWGLFLEKLAYKAESAGREFIKVDPRGTSQTCTCGNKVPKKLSQRQHLCTECGLSQGRDHTSAQVILQRGVGNRPSVANVEVVNSSVGREALQEVV